MRDRLIETAGREFYEDGLTIAEIAEKHGWTFMTTKSRIKNYANINGLPQTFKNGNSGNGAASSKRAKACKEVGEAYFDKGYTVREITLNTKLKAVSYAAKEGMIRKMITEYAENNGLVFNEDRTYPCNLLVDLFPDAFERVQGNVLFSLSTTGQIGKLIDDLKGKNQAAAVYARYRDGLTVEQVAESLRITREGARQKIQLAIKQLSNRSMYRTAFSDLRDRLEERSEDHTLARSEKELLANISKVLNMSILDVPITDLGLKKATLKRLTDYGIKTLRSFENEYTLDSIGVLTTVMKRELTAVAGAEGYRLK